MGVNCSQSVPVYVTQRCGSLWVVVDRCGIVVGRCGSLWIIVGRCGSFRVLVTTGMIEGARVYEGRAWESRKE